MQQHGVKPPEILGIALVAWVKQQDTPINSDLLKRDNGFMGVPSFAYWEWGNFSRCLTAQPNPKGDQKQQYTLPPPAANVS